MHAHGGEDHFKLRALGFSDAPQQRQEAPSTADECKRQKTLPKTTKKGSPYVRADLFTVGGGVGGVSARSDSELRSVREAQTI